MPGQESAPELPMGDETVLIAEDEPLMRSLAVQVLSRQGFKVLEAANGQEALKIALQHKGAPIDMLITDMVMPYMGGSELAEKFAPVFPSAKIFFISGYIDHSAVQRWIDKGSHFLQKPFTHTELVLAVRETLDGKPQEKSARA